MSFILQKSTNLTPALLQELGRFRVEVYRGDGVGIQDDLLVDGAWLDEVDSLPETIHWIVRDQGMIIAAARLSFHERFAEVPDSAFFHHLVNEKSGAFASLNRLVVASAYRGLGLARFLDRQRLTEIQKHSAHTILICALGERRAATMKRYGFKEHGQISKKGWDIGAQKFVLMSAIPENVWSHLQQPGFSTAGILDTNRMPDLPAFRITHP